MSTHVQFDHATGRLTITGPSGAQVFQAQNNVDSHAIGPWPPGTYKLQTWNHHPDDNPNSKFGARGIAIFDVPNRTGMGIHSGQAEVPDGLGRVGPAHATEGCIRTTDSAMTYLQAAHTADQIDSLVVT